MARYLGPVCKLCRRPYPPGQHGQGRIKLSEYGLRLREKQKMRRIYGLLELQFARYYGEATTMPGRTGEEMLGIIERRLDNVVYRMGFAASRIQGRQLVRHGHVLINGKRVDIPSYRVKPNDTIAIAEKSKKIGFVQAALAAAETRPRGSWLEVDKDNLTGVFRSMPVRDEMNEPMVREQYVVEYYSR